ncbi:MAG TPA: glycosyltransferase family 2 protein [Candidatus Limnocylindria bacterium]|nr:glycosyltransferase family 2 protein [Candidatus Limnocylindria bacterium]
MLPLSVPGDAARRSAPVLDGLSVVVPVHDEEGAVAGVVHALARELPGVARRYEVIVVDDGSTDRTAVVLAALRRTVPQLRVVRHAGNRGYGAALRSGFAAARHPWVLLIDGDGQIDPGALRDVVAALDGHDGVVGYRVRRADALARRVNTFAWNGAVRWLFGLAPRDVNCALKLLPAELVQDHALQTDGAVISAEILVRAARAGYRLAEVPVMHRPRRSGRASGARPSVVARAGVELVRLYWRTRREARA